MSAEAPNIWEHLQVAATARAAAGLTRVLHPRGPRLGIHGRVDSELDAASNDYLSLATDPRLVAAATSATALWGTGATASRLVVGALGLHRELEATLADFVGIEAALLFSSGYLANLGLLTALTDSETLVLSDAANHASLIDGARLSRGTVTVFPTGDVEAVARLLGERRQPRAVVVTDAIFSVDGRLAPVGDLHRVARAQGAALLIDEAHAIGVVGPGGRGTAAAAGIAGEPDVVVSLTLSKALGAQGGAVLGPRVVIDALVNTARSMIFDTGLAPAPAAAATAALQILAAEPDLPQQVREVATAIRSAALAAGWQSPPTHGAVVSVIVGDPNAAVTAQRRCADYGVSVGCFRPPSVPPGGSCLRITARAGMTPTDIEQIAAALRAARDQSAPAAPTEGVGRIRLVTGTGTGVGKTIVTAALAALATAQGTRVTVVKPVQTGLGPDEPGDVDVVAGLTGDAVKCLELIRYPDPLSPEAAARISGAPQPQLPELVRTIIDLAQAADLVLVEGAGGALVRFNDAGETFADLAHAVADASDGPVDTVVVAEPALGTLNHTALTLEALAARGIAGAGVVVGAWPREPDLACYQNLVDLPKIIGADLLGALPAGAGQYTRSQFLAVAEAGLGPAVGGRFNGTIETTGATDVGETPA